MNIRELKEGDEFEVTRNQRKYVFIKYSSELRPKDCLAKGIHDGVDIFIDLRTKINQVEPPTLKEIK